MVLYIPCTRECSVISAVGTPGTREYPVISAFGTPVTLEPSVISAISIPGAGEHSVISAFLWYSRGTRQSFRLVVLQGLSHSKWLVLASHWAPKTGTGTHSDDFCTIYLLWMKHFGYPCAIIAARHEPAEQRCKRSVFGWKLNVYCDQASRALAADKVDQQVHYRIRRTWCISHPPWGAVFQVRLLDNQDARCQYRTICIRRALGQKITTTLTFLHRHYLNCCCGDPDHGISVKGEWHTPSYVYRGSICRTKYIRVQVRTRSFWRTDTPSYEHVRSNYHAQPAK